MQEPAHVALLGGSNAGGLPFTAFLESHMSLVLHAAKVESELLDSGQPSVPLSDTHNAHTDAAISLKWRRYLVWTATVGRKRKILPGAREPRVRTRARIRLVWKGAGHMRSEFGPHRSGCSRGCPRARMPPRRRQ